MYFSIFAHSKRDRGKAFQQRLFDKITGKEITGVRWVDDKRGIYERIKFDENGQALLNKKKDGVLTEICRGKIKFRRVV